MCLEAILLPLRRVSIKRMLVNLLENALRYGGQGVEVAATVIRDAESAYVAISVLDRGGGLILKTCSAFLIQLFAVIRRTWAGAGLGFAIVHMLLRSMEQC